MIEISLRKELSPFTLDVSFEAGHGLVAVFGPSGSGKSLTLQCIAGLLKPDRGRIVINDRVVYDSALGINLRPQERRIGYVFQNYALLPHLTVEQNIGYGLNRLPKAERNRRVEEMILTTRLDGLEQRRPSELSGGQQQRVALARALVTEPDLLLLDEPFSALDSAIRGRLHAELLALLRKLPITALLVTHNLSEAYTLSETIVVYDEGRVLQVGPRDEILHRPINRTVARFTGTKNVLQGEVIEKNPDSMRVRVGLLTLTTEPAACEIGEVVDVCIRPEEIMLIRPHEEVKAAVRENQLEAEIVDEIAHGSDYTLLVKLIGDPLATGKMYDFHVNIGAHVYYRLGVSRTRQWTISLKKEAIHVIGKATEDARDRESIRKTSKPVGAR